MPTDEEPYPTIPKLLTAPFWTQEKYSELLASFAERREVPKAFISKTADLAELQVPHKDAARRIVAYKASAEIPHRAMAVPAHLIVIVATPTTLS